MFLMVHLVSKTLRRSILRGPKGYTLAGKRVLLDDHPERCAVSDVADHADGNEIELVGHAQEEREEAEHAGFEEDAEADAPVPPDASEGEGVHHAEGDAVPVVIRPAG